jgi:signal transduction histidine kinase
VTTLEPSWPESIDPIVRQLLASPEPTAIGYGPSLRAVHNDAFAKTIGAESRPNGGPRSLRDLCAELWPRLAPLIDRALESGESTLLEDQLLCRFRGGYAEEAYLSFACGPLMQSSGAVAGVVVTMTDNTDRVISVRRTAALRAIVAAAPPKCSVEVACQRAMAAVSRHASDLPFALLYLLARERDALRLVAAAGVPPGTTASPEVIDLHPSDAPRGWPLNRTLTGETVVVDDVLNRFGTLPAGDWPFAPRSAAVVPVTSPGREAPEGVMICGVSARHALDASYRAFIDLVVNQIAAAIAGGRVHEEEERAAKARAAARIAQAKRRARLRALKAKFAGALEERTRLAREIHDTLLQGVTGIAIQLRAVLPDVKTTPDTAATALQSIVELAERTSCEARQAVWDMRPTTHSRRDLARTLEIAARRLIASTSIHLHVSATGGAQPLEAQQEAAIVRIVQEAIANAVRHAEPRSIHLQVVFDSQGLRVSVVDDGCGFTVEEDFHSYDGHWGLLGMKERANQLGGALAVESAPGRGTTVTLRLPSGTRARRGLQAVS